MACQPSCLNHTVFRSVQPVYSVPSLTYGGSYSNQYTVLVPSVWLPKASLGLRLSENVCCAGADVWSFCMISFSFFDSSLLQQSFPNVSVSFGHFLSTMMHCLWVGSLPHCTRIPCQSAEAGSFQRFHLHMCLPGCLPAPAEQLTLSSGHSLQISTPCT